MQGEPLSSLASEDFEQLLRERMPELGNLENLKMLRFSNWDSAEMQPGVWSNLARSIAEQLRGVRGCVIIHGTDTMAETAAALSFMFRNPPVPIVLTGAQRPLTFERSDARQNLINAFIAARRGPKEVMVCFGNKLFRGNRVRKISSTEYDAFDSPNFPPLGTFGVHEHFEKGIRSKGDFSVKTLLEHRVILLRIFPGFVPKMFIKLLPQVRGVVLETYGAGTFPALDSVDTSLVPFLRAARENNVKVLLISQTLRGGVKLGSYQSGQIALSEGALSGSDLTPSAALVKMMYGLANAPTEKLDSYLCNPVAGEMRADKPKSADKR